MNELDVSSLKKAQENWIGDCCGTNIEYKIKIDGQITDKTVKVWTDKPEFLHGAQFILLHPDHILNDTIKENAAGYIERAISFSDFLMADLPFNIHS